MLGAADRMYYLFRMRDSRAERGNWGKSSASFQSVERLESPFLRVFRFAPGSRPNRWLADDMLANACRL